MRTAESPIGGTTVGSRFIATYTLAQVGAFIGFVPLLSVLLPMKASVVAPLSASLLLGQVAIAGSIAAAISHLVVGICSDLTRTPLGRRRPWILGGAAATSLSYLGIYFADTPAELMLAIIGFQIAFNMMFAPLVAIFADSVPDRRKGLVSAFVGLAHPAANLFAALVIAMLLTSTAWRYIAISLAGLVLVVPFAAWSYREPPAAPRLTVDFWGTLDAFRDRDFLIAFCSRLLVQTAIAMNALYLLFYLQQETDAARALPGMRTEAVLGLLIVVATLAALAGGFITGVWSDRIGRRKVFVTAGGVAIAIGAAIFALAPGWPGPLVGQVIFGAGLGVFSTADTALIAQVLPARSRIGRDLGLMNIAVTLPQVLAPLGGIVLLTVLGLSLTTVFGMASVLALTGAVLIHWVTRNL